MSDRSEERALVALLAKGLLSDAETEVSEEEAASVMKEELSLSEDEQRMLAHLDPLAFFAKGDVASGKVVAFPTAGEELPRAVGFNRGVKADEYSAATNEAIARRRKEIVEKLRKQKEAGANQKK